MSELRIEAINLMQVIPEENLSEIISYAKNFLKSKENISELDRRIDDARNGRNMVEHDLIEVD